ncbi:MAG: sensor histidine kinase [Treponema sp.]|nr:sensor histidine kinase [Treponema sp.]
MNKPAKAKSLKKNLQISFLFIIAIMIIPTIYSLLALQFHIKQYDEIITNVSEANRMNLIAENEIPTRLWNIVCGKQSFKSDSPYILIDELFSGISSIQERTKNGRNTEGLEVAQRACTTLLRNVAILQQDMDNGSTVTQNEDSLEEIRTITALFSDIIQDYIISEIESANITNESIRKSSLVVTILQIVIIVFSLLVAVNSYFSFETSFGKPMENLQQLSTEISQGHLTARTTVPNVKELTPLAENMNLMAEQIELLIQKNIEEQKNFQKAEMKALQAQITPHFLYNTFDTIIWLAEEGDTDNVVKITKAFSEFLRISLSRGHEWITIQQELDHIRNYLTIQKIRYSEIINYEIKVNPDLNDFKIIKLVLQPLVENAIYHGLKNKRGRGHLTVSVDFEDDSHKFIKFSVEDDGAGFTPERLIEVQQEMQSDTNSEQLSSVYGLYNVNKKLKLYYGENSHGLIIQSEYKKGTVISFVIPCVTETENV